MLDLRARLPLARLCVGAAFTALLSLLLFEVEGEKPGPMRASLAEQRAEPLLTSALPKASQRRDVTRNDVQAMTQSVVTDGAEFSATWRVVISGNGGSRLDNAQVELWEHPLPFEFAMAIERGGAASVRVQSGVTNGVGAFTFADVLVRDARGYEIRAFHPSYAPATLGVPHLAWQSERQEHELRMNEGFRLFGRVLAKSTSAPLGGARLIVRKANTMAVFLGGSSSEPAENDFVVRTDGNGRYEVKHAPHGCVEVVVRAKGHAESRETTLLDEAMLSTRDKELDFRLDVGGAISGYVEALDGSLPSIVEVSARRRDKDDWSNVTAKSDVDGTFCLEGVRTDGEYVLSVHCPGYICEGQPTAKSGDQDIVVFMAKFGRIVGRVVHAPTPQPLCAFTATVFACRGTARELPQPEAPADDSTDAMRSGTGSATDATALAPGEANGGNLGFGTFGISDIEKPSSTALEPTSSPHASSGEPPVSYIELRSTQRIIASRDGSFELDGIVCDGTYVVRIEAPGFAPAVSVPFTCAKGMTADVGEIQLDSGGELTGTVLDRLGVPVSSATVQVYCAGKDPSEYPINVTLGPIRPQPLQQKSTTTDHKGRYSVSMLIPTWATIVVEKRGFAGAEPVEVEMRAGEITEVPPIVLKDGGRIYGVVRRSNTAPKRGTTVSVRSADYANRGRFVSRDMEAGRGGRFEFVGLPAGKYKIHAASRIAGREANPFKIISDIRRSEQVVEVLEGKHHEVTLSLMTSEASSSVASSGHRGGE